MHSYVYDTFNCFINHKTKININLHKANEFVKDRKFLDVLFHAIVKKRLDILDYKYADKYIGIQDE